MYVYDNFAYSVIYLEILLLFPGIWIAYILTFPPLSYVLKALVSGFSLPTSYMYVPAAREAAGT